MDVVREEPGNEGERYILDVPGIARELHVQLKRYIEAQYPIRHASVVAERQALLETPGVITREPFIESTPGYTPGPSYSELALPLHMKKALEEFASWDRPRVPVHLYKHQAQALDAFLGHGNDLVVVTGTGSGKTETFLLPILLRSFEEASCARVRSRCRPCVRSSSTR